MISQLWALMNPTGCSQAVWSFGCLCAQIMLTSGSPSEVAGLSSSASLAEGVLSSCSPYFPLSLSKGYTEAGCVSQKRYDKASQMNSMLEEGTEALKAVEFSCTKWARLIPEATISTNRGTLLRYWLTLTALLGVISMRPQKRCGIETLHPLLLLSQVYLAL